MLVGRRIVLGGLATLALASCGARIPAQGAAPAAAANEFAPAPDPGWEAWVASFKGRAAAAGIIAFTRLRGRTASPVRRPGHARP